METLLLSATPGREAVARLYQPLLSANSNRMIGSGLRLRQVRLRLDVRRNNSVREGALEQTAQGDRGVTEPGVV